MPSPTDIGLAFYPDALYVLVSLGEDEAGPARPARPASAPGGSSTARSTRWPSTSSRDEAGRPARGVGAAIAVGLGDLALVAATVVGSNDGWLDALVSPPPLVRAALVGGTVALGLRAARRASIDRMRGAGTDDVPGLIRAVRLAFLAVAAFAAAAGWALGHPLPLIVAAVIAGIDVIETSFLLLVVGRPLGRGPPQRSAASPPTRSMSRSRNVGTSASAATSRFGRGPSGRRRSATVMPVVSSPRVSTST